MNWAVDYLKTLGSDATPTTFNPRGDLLKKIFINRLKNNN